MSSCFSKKIGICCHCLCEIDDLDDYRTISRGLIHEECVDELVGDVISNMDRYTKIEILNERGLL